MRLGAEDQLAHPALAEVRPHVVPGADDQVTPGYNGVGGVAHEATPVPDGAAAAVVVHAGDRQHGHGRGGQLLGLRPVDLPVGPRLGVVDRLEDPLVERGAGGDRGLHQRGAGQRRVVQVPVPVGDVAGDGELRGAVADEAAPAEVVQGRDAAAGQIDAHAAGGIGSGRFQRRRRRSHDEVLVDAGVGAAVQRHLAVAPVLGGDPLDRVVAVARVAQERHEVAVAGAASAHVDGHVREALGRPEHPVFIEVVDAVRGELHHGADGRGLAARAPHGCVQRQAVAQRDAHADRRDHRLRARGRVLQAAVRPPCSFLPLAAAVIAGVDAREEVRDEHHGACLLLRVATVRALLQDAPLGAGDALVHGLHHRGRGFVVAPGEQQRGDGDLAEARPDVPLVELRGRAPARELGAAGHHVVHAVVLLEELQRGHLPLGRIVHAQHVSALPHRVGRLEGVAVHAAGGLLGIEDGEHLGRQLATQAQGLAVPLFDAGRAALEYQTEHALCARQHVLQRQHAPPRLPDQVHLMQAERLAQGGELAPEQVDGERPRLLEARVGDARTAPADLVVPDDATSRRCEALERAEVLAVVAGAPVQEQHRWPIVCGARDAAPRTAELGQQLEDPLDRRVRGRGSVMTPAVTGRA